MDVWVLEHSCKDIDQPGHFGLGAEVFSCRERALEWLAQCGWHIRWQYSKHNPDWQKGSTTVGPVRTHFVLSKRTVDEALLEDAE